MPLNIPRLRRWLVTAAVALSCLVAASYFYARHRLQNNLKQIPDKIDVEIQQSAKGFTISKSFQGHTLFKIEASKAVQFKEGGRGELHDVEITVYGHDSGRFDRITGKRFEYDPFTGDVIGKGEVQIDLEANPEGLGKPDQLVPNDLKNPIHLKTADLVFNQKTGDAHADGEVDFDVPQAHGSATGLNYISQSSVLTLNSQVRVTLSGLSPISITAAKLTLSRSPRTLLLEHPQVTEGSEHSQADKATVYLTQENKLERVLAQGGVFIESDRPDGGKITAGQLELSAGAGNSLHSATLLDNVLYESFGEGGIQGTAGRAVINFAAHSEIRNVHADEGVSLIQSSTKKNKQGFELAAPGMDFSLAHGRLIQRAETLGPPQITLTSTGNEKAFDSTIITAAQFEASFDTEGRLAAVHGGPDSRIVSRSRGKLDRVSTSQTTDAEFVRGKGIVALLQKGNFAYSDGKIRAWADDARYTPQDQIVLLEGSPRATDGGMTTSAQTIRLNRLTGSAYAEGNVKATEVPFSSRTSEGRKPSTDRTMNSPIHITATKMTASRDSATAIFEGSVRLWQGANSVEAPTIELHREDRTVVAVQTGAQRVKTSLSQTDKKGKITLLTVLADRLKYSDDQKIVHFEGHVEGASSGITLTAAKMDCFFRGRAEAPQKAQLTSGMALEKIVADGGVLISQPGRRATGNKVVYTAAGDKFVMTGGPPSIFDAEHGNVTGDSLTLFGHDARVLVEGSKQSPAVTEIRVAR